MESSDPSRFMDDLLDFGPEEGEEEEEDEGEEEEEEQRQQPGNKKARGRVGSSFTPTALGSALLTVLRPRDGSTDPALVEEELEWISNKDAFPAVETFPGFLSSNSMFLPASQSSPVSVLESAAPPAAAPATLTSSNSSGSRSSSSSGSSSNSIVTNYCGGLRVPPKRARSKRRPAQQEQCSWYKYEGVLAKQAEARAPSRALGRKCQHCGVEKTPQWRAGPLGAKTLCNACGVRYKSGRLVPEYRPANSPTFSSDLHSNSHRKVVEMRRQKQIMGLPVAQPFDKGVG